ncbi:MAG: GHKL domain-containing protein [Clostridiales bacterium]|jgi:hypothetical protein|nr:GHKL domain-containing protein [Clostridiales bacterium]
MPEVIIPDIPRLCTALAEWAGCMVYVLALKKRFPAAKSCVLAALFLAAFCGLQLLAGSLPVAWWIPGMIAAAALIYACILVMCKCKPVDVLYWMARAFMLAEFAASVEWQLYYFFTGNTAVAPLYIEISAVAAIYSAVFAVAYILERRYLDSNRHFGISLRDLLPSVATVVVVFVISNISFVSRATPLSGRFASEIFYIRTLVDLCGLVLLYGQQEQRQWSNARVELNAMQNVLMRQYDQYRMSKENTELLNRRYHDLKHQIEIIKLEKNNSKKTEYIERLEEAVKQFNTQSDTGNHVLDVILTDKRNFCEGNGINLTCVTDGTLLHFMDPMDICSIVGNALDNAIESVQKLRDPEKRLIKVAIYAQNELLVMKFENYIENLPRFEGGLPVTTKSKHENHGYGVKSIKAAAERYGGRISVGTAQNDRWFTLHLIIPRTTVPAAEGENEYTAV